MIKRSWSIVTLLMSLSALVNFTSAQKLSMDDLFPRDRVLDIKITVEEKDWDTIRFQSRNIRKELSAARKLAPIEPPYTFVMARASIDGIDLGEIGLRKKGFIGSQSSTRPSLKIKLDFVDKAANIGGLTNLTFNNNRQDRTQMYQFMGYAFFNQAGSPAPRCSFAKITVNGKNLGVYSHVETVRRPLLKREFQNDQGTLYEGTVVDFYQGWEGSFENKLGSDKRGRKKINQLIDALKDRQGLTVLGSQAKGKAWIPTEAEYGSGWNQVEFDDAAWKSGTNGAGFETSKGFESLISETFDFAQPLHNQSTSLCLRFSFDLDDVQPILDVGGLFLHMKYDDGFVAWLNGQQIAAANNPGELAWNSAASKSHSDRAAMQFESFDISAFKDKLRKGKNVLAIQAMNISKSSPDMLCLAEIRANNLDYEKAIAEHVDLDAFYRYWAVEGLLGFWDGYAANRNNYFVYLNPNNNKFHFVPWGADSLFVKHGYLRRDRSEPLCVKTTGLVAYRLYQTKAGRDRYAAAMTQLLKQHWDEEKLLAEVERIETMLQPHLSESQARSMNLRSMRTFIETRRKDVEAEIAKGLPVWSKSVGEPPVIRGR